VVASATWDGLGTWCEVLTVHEEDLPEVAELAREHVRSLDRQRADDSGLDEVRAQAADRIADACASELGIGSLVNIGGDIAVRGEVPDGGWQVEIDDGHPGPLGRPVISMGWAGGLATASATTGAWRSVTVAARTCERADAAARAAIALGDAAPRWLTQRELPARLVHSGGVVVQTNGWPSQRWIS
jgi:thiamine biosynthesis lipoprotein